MSRGRVLRGLSCLLLLCLGACRNNQKIANPNIVMPGAPGNRPAGAPEAVPEGGPAGDVVFLGASIVQVPAGTPLAVRLEAGLDSGRSKAGDSFRAVLAEPLKTEAGIAVPDGALVLGQITDAATASGTEAASLSLNLLEVRVNNRWIGVRTDLLVIIAGGSTPAGGEAAPADDGNGGSIRTIRVPGDTVRIGSQETLRFTLVQPAVVEAEPVPAAAGQAGETTEGNGRPQTP